MVPQSMRLLTGFQSRYKMTGFRSANGINHIQTYNAVSSQTDYKILKIRQKKLISSVAYITILQHGAVDKKESYKRT
jgi:hypothetical protein